ncbi:MAG: ribonuclease III [Bauldia sp.]|nr:ribonuclease III [Bauldia sp.]
MTADAVLARLQAALGHRFSDPALLATALTHSSAAAEAGLGQVGTYERLEFLGDRVVGLIVAEMLFATFPREAESELARRLAALVRNDTFVSVARDIDLGEALRIGAGEQRLGGRRNATILGDTAEAVIGALYLDGGLEAARRFVETHWRPRIAEMVVPPRDAKSTLQEWAQGRGLPTPAYVVADQSGPHHAPRFIVEAVISGVQPARGEGRSKREAEQQAAAEFLRREGIWKVAP